MNLRNEHGFTLVEVIVAAMVLTLGLGIIGSITSGIITKNFHSRHHTQAVILAQNKIEELLNEGYNSANLSAGEYSHPFNPVNSFGDSAGIFNLSWKIDATTPIPRSKYITATVRWQDREGEEFSVVLSAACIDQSN